MNVDKKRMAGIVSGITVIVTVLCQLFDNMGA